MASTTEDIDYIQIDDESDEERVALPRRTKQELDKEGDGDDMDVCLPPPEWFDSDGWASPQLIASISCPNANTHVDVHLKRKREGTAGGTSGGGKNAAAPTQSKSTEEGKRKIKRKKKLAARKKKAAAMQQKVVVEKETATGDISDGEDLDTTLPVELNVVPKTVATISGRKRWKLRPEDEEDSNKDLVFLFETRSTAAPSASSTFNGRKNIKCEFANGSGTFWPSMDKLERGVGSSATTMSKYGVVTIADCRIMKAISACRNKFPKEFNQFNKAIWTHLTTNLQNDHTYTWKMRVRLILHEQIRIIFPNSLLLVVGSTVNGCGAYNSDMDLCLALLSPGDFQQFDSSKRGYAAKQLRKVRNILKHLHIVRHVEYIHAKVPILKMNFAPPYTNLEVDINVNNFAGVYNSFLLHNYSRIDDRFAAICLLVKHWAKIKGISDACAGYLNSYSLILMVLHFLQCGVEPPILPNLQQLYPDRFGRNCKLSDLNFFTDLPTPLPKIPQNNSTVGELLIAFFDYYNRFDFNRNAISVARGCVFPRTELPPNTQRFRLFIEEPFDHQNTARCVTNDEQWMVILDTFGKAANANSPHSKKAPDLLKIGIRI